MAYSVVVDGDHEFLLEWYEYLNSHKCGGTSAMYHSLSLSHSKTICEKQCVSYIMVSVYDLWCDHESVIYSVYMFT